MPRSSASPYFNPRSPHGERRRHYDNTRYHLLFQSTLPARGATTAKLKMLDSELFQSTLPARGATRALNVGLAVGSISIHAPRTGSDRCRRRTTPLPQYFNPRSPHGERRSWASPPPPSTRFQSTLPARGATRRSVQLGGQLPHFNPRSPHGERQDGRTPGMEANNFNPRSPHGERPPAGDERGGGMAFQSTLPARGAT